MKNLLKKINFFHIGLLGILIVVTVGVIVTTKNEKQQTVLAQDSSTEVAEQIPVVASETVSEPVVEIATEVAVPSDMDLFAKCLTTNGAKLYGASWCPHCQDQKKAFGESVQFVNYIECASGGSKVQAQVCKDAGITGYPTWKFADNSEILGKATFDQLSEKTLCPF